MDKASQIKDIEQKLHVLYSEVWAKNKEIEFLITQLDGLKSSKDENFYDSSTAERFKQ